MMPTRLNSPIFLVFARKNDSYNMNFASAGVGTFEFFSISIPWDPARFRFKNKSIPISIFSKISIPIPNATFDLRAFSHKAIVALRALFC